MNGKEPALRRYFLSGGLFSVLKAAADDPLVRCEHHMTVALA